jgi:hypothetical protein
VFHIWNTRGIYDLIGRCEVVDPLRSMINSLIIKVEYEYEFAVGFSVVLGSSATTVDSVERVQA